jgi:hypothetical protein
MTMHHRPSPAIALRAFIAYCEGGNNPTNPFALLPYAETIDLGIPFSETFIHEGIEWAVFVTGDVTPCELIALENAGVVDAN